MKAIPKIMANKMFLVDKWFEGTDLQQSGGAKVLAVEYTLIASDYLPQINPSDLPYLKERVGCEVELETEWITDEDDSPCCNNCGEEENFANTGNYAGGTEYKCGHCREVFQFSKKKEECLKLDESGCVVLKMDADQPRVDVAGSTNWRIRFCNPENKDDGESMFFVEADLPNAEENNHYPRIELMMEDFGNHNGYTREMRMADALRIVSAPQPPQASFTVEDMRKCFEAGGKLIDCNATIDLYWEYASFDEYLKTLTHE